LLSVTGQLVTAVAAANRRARLTVSDGVSVYQTLPGPADQAASLTWLYTWAPRVNNASDSTVQLVGVPVLYLEAGAILSTSTLNVQAADQWGALTASVVEETVTDGPVALDTGEDVYLEGVNPALLSG